MSVNQFSKCAPNESNIPLPKRNNTGIKKSKGCAQLPELQRYIETIIKASNDYDSEDTTHSEKDRFPKERKFGRYSMHRGLDGKVKQEKHKSHLSRCKNNIKASTPISEAVSRGVRVRNMYALEFEDSRNWKLGKIPNLGPKVEIEQFLKKFYPNPYRLESVTHFTQHNSKKDRDGTLPDVVISKANAHFSVDIEKTDLKTADIETCKRANDHVASTTNLGNYAAQHHENNSEYEADESASIPALERELSTTKSINSISNISSGTSSGGSLRESLSKDSQIGLKKRKSTKTKTRSKPYRQRDYDIGKLKLLNSTDSEQSLARKLEKKEIDSKFKDEKSVSDDIYKTEDLNELKEIYDIMYKATESFIHISSKNEYAEMSKNQLEPKTVSKCGSKDREVNSATNHSETNETENLAVEEKIDKKEATEVETKPETEEATVEKGLLNILLESNKFDYRFDPKIGKQEEVQERVSNCARPLPELLPMVEAYERKSVENFANEKPDEVLDFMYNCLLKFNSREQSEEEKPLEYSVSCKTFLHKNKESVTEVYNEGPTTSQPTDFGFTSQDDSDSSEKLLLKNFLDVQEDIQTKYSAALNEINRTTSRTLCKKRHGFVTHESTSYISIPGATTSAPQPQAEQHSAEEINDTRVFSVIQTVESQNELGSFAEEAHECTISVDDNRIPKPICVLSGKRRLAGKKLKDALEAEEKLISGGSKTEEKPKEVKQVRLRSNTTTSSPHFGDYRCQSSNFVVCMKSFSRNMRSVKVGPKLPLSDTASLSNLRNMNFREMTLSSPKFSLKKISITTQADCWAAERAYKIKQEILLNGNKAVVVHLARTVCLKITGNISKSVEEILKKNSLKVVVGHVQQAEPESNPSLKKLSEVITEEYKPVNDLMEAIKDAEEKVFLLEQTSAENLYSRNSETCSLSASNMQWNLSSENVIEKMNDAKKIYELLQRTYNLQKKLQRYLQKVTCTKQNSVSCLLLKREGSLDVSLVNKTNNEFDGSQENSLPIVHWHLMPEEIDNKLKAEESVAMNLSMVDQSTLYDPPTEDGSCEKVEEQKEETKLPPGKENEDLGNEEDDQSSNCSFKSSNDFSDTSEGPSSKKDPKNSEYKSNKKFFQKIFYEIESFRQSFEGDKIEKQTETSPKEEEESVERRLTQYEPKASLAKVLRTVFTGKKSSTELTIGLKEVPMTKLGNISVERTKFSPNHTKISIAFTKENMTDYNKLSPYTYDNVRPSFSSCETESSGVKDDDGKSSRSAKDDSEDDEDDYKSVASTVDGNPMSDDEEEVEKTEPKEEKKSGQYSPKNYVKHRFDFYRKMNTDFDTIKSKHKSLNTPVCRYKELEPLKEALTDLQIRMRNIRREAIFSSDDYYERALKLAKMSAGFCQSCGTRAVIPNDTFGYYRSLLPPRPTQNRRSRHFRSTIMPNPSFYSLRSTNSEVPDFCELGVKRGSYLLNSRFPSNPAILRGSLHDMPIFF